MSEVIEHGLEQALARSETVVDSETRNTRLASHSVDAEPGPANEYRPCGADDPRARGIHADAALLQLIGPRAHSCVAGLARVFGPVSVVAILVPGLYMMITSWGWVPWIAAGLLVWLLIAVLGAVNGIRLSVATQHAAADAAAIHQLRAGAFVVSWWMRITLALGIVFLMTTKPDLLGASLSVVIAAAIGLAAGTLSVTTSPRPALSR